MDRDLRERVHGVAMMQTWQGIVLVAVTVQVFKWWSIPVFGLGFAIAAWSEAAMRRRGL